MLFKHTKIKFRALHIYIVEISGVASKFLELLFELHIPG